MISEKVFVNIMGTKVFSQFVRMATCVGELVRWVHLDGAATF